MSDNHHTEFQGSRSRKRSHREMSHSHSHYQNRSQWSHFGESSSSSAPHQHTLSLPIPQPRYQGHGFDFRRPIMSTPSQTEQFVDLTNEPDSPPAQFSQHQPNRSRSVHRHIPHHHRPPRFGRNIMTDVVDLEREEEEVEGEEDDDDIIEEAIEDVIDLDPPGSPEVQFVRATTRPRPSAMISTSRLLDVINIRAQQGFLSSQDAVRREIALRARDIGRRRLNHPSWEEVFFGDPNPNVDLTLDADWDIQVPGFTIHEPLPSTPPPSYRPPTPPPEGFTRTVGESDVVVCPNCDRELGAGEGLNQQIWVAKQCGHVYCGECTTNRAMKKKTTAPVRTKPFSKCQVSDCGKLVSQPKSMIQIYL